MVTPTSTGGPETSICCINLKKANEIIEIKRRELPKENKSVDEFNQITFSYNVSNLYKTEIAF